jgi:hypothetical protein
MLVSRNERHGAAASTSIEVVEVRTNHGFATWRNMLLVIWRYETDADAVRRARIALIELKKRFPNGIALMQVAEADAKPPDPDARGAIAELLAAGRDSVACSSLVYGGTGFWMASVRALVAGVAMLARPGFPHQVFATVDAAADWHSRLVPPVDADGRSPTKNEIRAALDSLGRLLDRSAR